MKTNKSYTKRLRVTRRGKIIARAPGQNHFNAKESSAKRMRRARATTLTMTKRETRQFLPRSK